MQIIPPKVDWKTKYVSKYFKEKYKKQMKPRSFNFPAILTYCNLY